MPRIPEVYPSVFCPHSSNIASCFLRILPSASCRLPPVFTAVCLLFLLVTFHSSLSTVRAQSATATLSGTVVDQNGAVVPDVNIAVISIAQGFQRSATTREQGTFVVPLLPPGNYTVKAEHQGFAPAEVRDVVLNVNDQVAIRIHMKVGSVSQTVEIVDGGSLINESPAVGTMVDRQFVENLPLNGRSFQSLIALAPGVVLTKTQFQDQGQFSVNGQRANANYFMIDGVSANAGVSAGLGLGQSGGGALPAFGATGGTNSLVSVDAMQEFKIQTSTFAPEFGRTPGAQVQIATRSGTNDFRGTVFEYFRNDALDANDWFANSRPLTAQQLAQGLTKQKRAALRQNDFGGVLGGPLYLPRFGEGGPSFNSGKNRTFFFFSYEGLRLRLPQNQISLVPSVASRQAALPSRKPFLDAYPIPNGQVFSNGFAEFNASYSDPINLDATSIRIDHTFNDKLTLFGRYNYSPSGTTQRGTSSTNSSLSTIAKDKFKTQTLTFGTTQTFTPAVSNEIRVNYTRSEGKGVRFLDNFGAAVPVPDSLVFPPFATSENSLFLFQVVGGRGMTIGKNVDNLQRQINLVDNVSFITASHQLKFGVDYRLLLPADGPRGYDQIITFIGLTGASGAISGNTRLVSATARETLPLRFVNFSAYGQDTWKATRRLTVTGGLRWDVNPAPKRRDGKDLFTFENLDNPTAVKVAPTATLYETTYDNFAPRVGIAYQLSQRSGRETVLRGGFGVFYDLGSGAFGTAAGFPYARGRNTFGTAFPPPAAALEPPPFSLTIPTSGLAFIADRNLKLPRVYQWNAAVEQSLGTNQTVSASYVAAVGRRLLRQKGVVPIASFSVFITENTATSDYHAMQLQYQRRLSRGLQALASYTWAHSIDIASSDGPVGNTPLAPKSDRGNSDFDVRHAFNAAVTYDVPTPKARAFANAIIRNWSVDTILTTRSATPVNLIARTDFVGGVRTTVRPDLVSGLPLYIDDPTFAGGRRLNRAAFVAPPAGRQGTLGRNVVRGFSMWQMDLSLRRRFNLTERMNVQFRAEFFNLFNHPNFGDPSSLEGSSLTSPLFGQSTSMLGRSLGSGGGSGGFNPLYQVGGPRSIQFAIRLNF